MIAWNSAIEKLLGYPAAEAIGRNCAGILQARDVFGNTYCRKNCPLLESDGPVHHCDLFARTEMAASIKVRVHTFTVPEDDPQDTFVVHFLESLEEVDGTFEPAQPQAQPSLNPNLTAELQRLTKRQRQVLRMVARGMKTQEIAEMLGISVKTTRNHIQNINERLGVHTRSGAVALALRAGIV